MRNMTLKNIAEACHGRYNGTVDLLEKEVSSVVTDSRQVEEDNLFIAITGTRVDGHQFIPKAAEDGAVAVICEKPQDGLKIPWIQVDSSEQALKDIAELYRSMLAIPVVGIAGSVGKTSTKEMIASVLSRKYKVLKTEGNFNNEIGMPLTLLKIRPEHEVAVIEMGISNFGEMHRLAKVARPDICVMTNIGQAHLEFLGSRDGILRAKSEIFDFLKPTGIVILNGNDDKLDTITDIKGILPERYYVEDGSAPEPSAPETVRLRVKNIRDSGLEGMKADLAFQSPSAGKSAEAVHPSDVSGEEGLSAVQEERIPITEPIPGRHNLYNAAAAALVGRKLHLTFEEIAAGIADAKTIAGRLNLIHLKNHIIVIDDCYNANPASMKSSLDVLAEARGRKIAILGDMGELGENAAALHREVGRKASDNRIDILYCCGDLSAEMAEAAQKAGGCGAVRHFEKREDLLNILQETVRAGDAILVKASHFMGFSEIVDALREKYEKKQSVK